MIGLAIFASVMVVLLIVYTVALFTKNDTLAMWIICIFIVIGVIALIAKVALLWMGALGVVI